MEGWQGGAAVLLLFGSFVLAIMPRHVEARQLPAPAIDRAALRATMSRDDALAAQAAATVLDVDIRSVGREFRSYNQAEVSGRDDALWEARRRLTLAARAAVKRSPQELLQLRAYQTKRFIEEVRKWQGGGEASEELEALAGEFMGMVSVNAWCEPGTRRLTVDEKLLRILYKKRWNQVVGTKGKDFQLTLDENRFRYGFFLERPLHVRRVTNKGGTGTGATASRNSASTLKVIRQLAALDPSYPANFARGVVHFRQSRYPLAVRAFERHLHERPDGPYTLRARNHLKASLDKVRSGAM